MSGPNAGLTARLVAEIRANGPMTVARYMAACLYDPDEGYYARHARIGADGDFVTAPEISQMFGELIGLWCAQSWVEIGSPQRTWWIELGPGRGTLMADAARAAAKAAPAFRAVADIAFVEVNPRFAALQAAAVPDGQGFARLEDVPPGPTLLLANELLDCLPARQFVRRDGAWRERLVGVSGGTLAFGLAREPAPLAFGDAPEGAVRELQPGLEPLIAAVAERLHAAPGRALFIDYGDEGGDGDTLQALRRHEKVSPLTDPGRVDLTVHVDFAAVAGYARAAGLDVAGPTPQGAWLEVLGLRQRSARLAASRPDQAETIAAAVHRLAAPDAMGTLFKAICLSSPGLPPPAGFP